MPRPGVEATASSSAGVALRPGSVASQAKPVTTASSKVGPAQHVQSRGSRGDPPQRKSLHGHKHWLAVTCLATSWGPHLHLPAAILTPICADVPSSHLLVANCPHICSSQAECTDHIMKIQQAICDVTAAKCIGPRPDVLHIWPATFPCAIPMLRGSILECRLQAGHSLCLPRLRAEAT